MASRILGMGDVVSLVEKAQETIDEQEAAQMAEKLRKADFNLETFEANAANENGLLPDWGMLPGMSASKLAMKKRRNGATRPSFYP